jgi:hypothetical protein
MCLSIFENAPAELLNQYSDQFINLLLQHAHNHYTTNYNFIKDKNSEEFFFVGYP